MGHVRGFDSNSAQFERMGNPWVSDRDRAEFSAPNKKERRQNRNGAKPAVTLGNFPKSQPERTSRIGSPALQQVKARSNFINLFRANLPGGTREVVGINPAPTPIVQTFKPAALTEMTGWQRFERQCLRHKQRAEVNERLARVAVEDEKAKLRRTIALAEARLAELG